MKWFTVFLIFTWAAWIIWTKHPEVLPTALVTSIQSYTSGNTAGTAPAPTPASATGSVPAPQATPEVRKIEQAIAAKKPPMAEGEYCLLERISMTTDSGIIGIPAGTTVHRIKAKGSLIVVTDGSNIFSVKLSQVTQDPETAARLTQTEAQKSAAATAWQQTQLQSAQAQADATRAAINKVAASAMSLGNYNAEWQTDYQRALGQAKAENKKVLLDFTGSDWCGWCMKMEQETLSKQEFKDYAVKNLVLVQLDYPHEMPQSEQIKIQNQQLAAQFHVSSYPTFVLLDGNGRELGRVGGYREGGPVTFIAMLNNFKN